MMHCLDCNSSNIRTRKNHTHGSSSTTKKSRTCKDCGSHKIKIEVQRNFRRR
ncbi:MAG: hypothetical protein VX028_02990 [Nanoarchaeota archaeon]|nr:hypothetical protein [Nanoarchaeota archaeon]